MTNKDFPKEPANRLDWKYFCWKDLLAVVLTVFLLSLSYPEPDMGHFAWIALVPWFLLICSRDSAPIIASFLVGAVFFLYNLHWLSHVTCAGWLALSLYQAVYFVAFAAACNFLYRALGLPFFVFAPFLWVAQEYLRCILTGFPWLFLAHTQYSYLSIIQISDITGAYGVSFMVVVINACFTEGIMRWSRGKAPHMPVTLAFVIALVPLSYGMFRLAGLGIEEGPRLSVVQGNIPLSLKMDKRLEQRKANLNKYLLLSRKVRVGSTDLVVWPETMAPGLLNIDPKVFDREIDYLSQSSITGLAKDLKAYLLVGGISLDPDTYSYKEKTFYNSAFLYNPQGSLIERYDKLHLVPFGEYTPFKKYFPFLKKIVPYQTGLTPGKNWHLFTINTRDGKKFRFATLICYEDTVPQIARRFRQLGADFMINITNDAWFKDSPELDQHLAIMVFRAVENRVGVARAANTGISAFVAPTGDVYTLIHDKGKRREVEGVLEANILISPGGDRSWYTIHGDIFAQICLAVSIGFLLGPIIKRFYA
ncbi:MAG: apolipoprotein N-acyltransferase [Candidatus Brocadiales bacterium]|nr:apolipoprotein N-acyltransferase [Candidatus Bathyanammoxibius sp.]